MKNHIEANHAAAIPGPEAAMEGAYLASTLVV